MVVPAQKLDVSGHFLFGNGRSNSAEKHGRFTAINYNTAVNPMCVLYANGASSGNFVRFGGGTDSVSPVTSFSFFTATGTPANGEGTKRATLDSDGLKFGTDTAAANALSDYEVGSWTPAVTFGGAASGVGYTSNTNGRYVKVGGVVHVTGCLFLNNKGSSTGAAVITGLPFAHLNSSEGTKGSGSIGQTNISFSAFPSILGSGSELILFDTTTGGTLGAIDNSNFANASSIYFSATYTAS